MTTLNTVAKLYDRLTPHERLRLVMDAFARADDGEAERLVRACPRFTYTMMDWEYAQLYEMWTRKATEFALLWIEAAGRYQHVLTAILGMELVRERYIDGLNRGWQAAGMDGDFMDPDVADASPLHIETVKGADRERRARIGELKGMVAGLHRFCAAAKVDPSHFMAAWTPLLESIAEHRSVLDDPAIPTDEDIVTQIEAVLRLNWPGLDTACEGNDVR
jgi:hypothetical protein